ncbi:MAG: copper chaperone PCu(A)C [Sphingomonadales bacterium]|nr:copper chaperone PCu(A)C [Sphingomonadales bacterium]
MNFSRRLLLIAGTALMAVGLAGCDKAAKTLNPPDLHVDRAYVRLAANPDAPSALYFTVHGGAKDTRLLNVLIDYALRYEMHESAKGADGLVTMKKLEYADIPAGEDVKFAPGGKHVMVWGIDPKVIAANKMPVIFVFQNGDRIEFDAQFVQPGEDADAAMDHDGMAMGNEAAGNEAR